MRMQRNHREINSRKLYFIGDKRTTAVLIPGRGARAIKECTIYNNKEKAANLQQLITTVVDYQGRLKSQQASATCQTRPMILHYPVLRDSKVGGKAGELRGLSQRYPG